MNPIEADESYSLDPGIEQLRSLEEEKERFEVWVGEQCDKGNRLSMMLMIEKIVRDNRLDRFP